MTDSWRIVGGLENPMALAESKHETQVKTELSRSVKEDLMDNDQDVPVQIPPEIVDGLYWPDDKRNAERNEKGMAKQSR
jgi:hypothetical protein